MYTVPALGHRIQSLFDQGHDITALIEIYDQMRAMNQYGLPDINDYHYGKIQLRENPISPTFDLFNSHAAER